MEWLFIIAAIILVAGSFVLGHWRSERKIKEIKSRAVGDRPVLNSVTSHDDTLAYLREHLPQASAVAANLRWEIKLRTLAEDDGRLGQKGDVTLRLTLIDIFNPDGGSKTTKIMNLDSVKIENRTQAFRLTPNQHDFVYYRDLIKSGLKGYVNAGHGTYAESIADLLAWASKTLIAEERRLAPIEDRVELI